MPRPDSIKMRDDTFDPPTPAAKKAVAEAVPTEETTPVVEYPVDFEEWAAGQSGIYRVLVAGYRYRVRVAGELTAFKQREEWSEGFAAFRNEEVR